MNKTKSQLEKDLAVSLAGVARLKAEDERVRRVLCDMLDNVEYKPNDYGYTSKPKREVVVESWEGVAFLIGELKADANYHMCIEARELLRSENDKLKAKIRHLTEPKVSPNQVEQ